jgi:DNA-binding transcriptional LysR family regulator
MDEEIELRHLRYFLAVAETLHFSKAAQILGIAQPPLSQQIKRLEQLLGHRLFDRTTRGVKLTLAGHLLAERAHSTIEKVQDDLAQVRRLGRGEEGTLTVGFSGSVMFTDLPAAIERYRRRYPKVELRLIFCVAGPLSVSCAVSTLTSSATSPWLYSGAKRWRRLRLTRTSPSSP